MGIVSAIQGLLGRGGDDAESAMTGFECQSCGKTFAMSHATCDACGSSRVEQIE